MSVCSESSYDVNLAAQNKSVINTVFERFILNVQSIAQLTIEITPRILDENPEIIVEDEQKCRLREERDVTKWVDEQMGDFGDASTRRQYTKEAMEKFKRIRILEALPKLKMSWRVSHALLPGVYPIGRFYDNASDEPGEEMLYREMIGSRDGSETEEEAYEKENERLKNCHIIINKFISYTFPYWQVIFDRDMHFLTEHLNTLFPNSDITDKLEILYGNNDSQKNYIPTENIRQIWVKIHSMVKLSLKYMKYMGKSDFKIQRVGQETERVHIDVDRECEKWAVSFETR